MPNLPNTKTPHPNCAPGNQARPRILPACIVGVAKGTCAMISDSTEHLADSFMGLPNAHALGKSLAPKSQSGVGGGGRLLIDREDCDQFPAVEANGARNVYLRLFAKYTYGIRFQTLVQGPVPSYCEVITPLTEATRLYYHCGGALDN